MRTFTSLIAELGGPMPVSEYLGKWHTTVRYWRDNDMIPAQSWADIIRMAKSCRVKLTANELVNMADESK